MPKFADLIEEVDRVAIATFGDEVAIVYTAQTGEFATVTGIFDESYVLAKGSAEAGVETLGPAVFLRISDLPVDPLTDKPTITINGLDYKVTERRPDGIGGIMLAVRKKT